MALARQELSREEFIQIPPEVHDYYLQWRPTPLIRAARLESYLGTSARIYLKYEGANPSGSHKLNTAIAQAHYYKQAGAKRLVTATGAGQWGAALAQACHLMGLECKVFMVASSFLQKPYRRTLMEMYSAEVVASRADEAGGGSSLAAAISQAIEEARRRADSRFCIGSGEGYAILHQTVAGLEAEQQLRALGERPDVVIGCLGAGSNFGGIAFPFLRSRFRGGESPRCISAESSACPKLTRGRYAYDYTDSAGLSPLQKMYTLGSSFATPGIHAGGLRYHAASKIVSALYARGDIEAVAYGQHSVLQSGRLLLLTQGLLPAPESCHAVHAAIQEGLTAARNGTRSVILVSVSGHGLFDMAAYEDCARGSLTDDSVAPEELERALRALPRVTEPAAVRRELKAGVLS